jgi:radical SAM protein with 4Fe4S-binding SPASM domain
MILIDYYMQHPEYKTATILNLAIMDMNPEAETPKRFCGVGPYMKSYDIDGEAYPCHAFAPLCIGKEKAERAKKLDFSCPLSTELLDEKCRNCPVVGVCPTCYGINYGACENVYHINEDHCRMMKVQFLANALFQYKRYQSGRLDLSEEEELRLLRNIQAVQKLAD